MHVLITGGAGFIGSHLAEYHLRRGDAVYVVDNLSTGSQDNLELLIQYDAFQYEIADLLTWDKLTDAVIWSDRIYHLAAVVGMFRVLEDPLTVLESNIGGCQRLLQTIAANHRNQRVMIASSSEVYGATTQQASTEDALLLLKSSAHSQWNYAVSKLANESFSLAYARKNATRITIVRLFNTIGPRQRGNYGMVVPRLIQQALIGEPITVYGDGNQTRSFCDVRDTVIMLDLLLNNPHSVNTIVNLGGDREISINQLALLIKQITQSNSPIAHISYADAYGEIVDDKPLRRPCLNKLRSLINYNNQWSLEDTIQDLGILKKSTKFQQ